jgi:hypothetical protein
MALRNKRWTVQAEAHRTVKSQDVEADLISHRSAASVGMAWKYASVAFRWSFWHPSIDVTGFPPDAGVVPTTRYNAPIGHDLNFAHARQRKSGSFIATSSMRHRQE